MGKLNCLFFGSVSPSVLIKRITEFSSILIFFFISSIEGSVKTPSNAPIVDAPDSKVRVLVVPTNEEYMIALDVQEQGACVDACFVA